MRNLAGWSLVLGLVAGSVQSAQAGVVIGGTRFVFGEKSSALNVSLRNNSEMTWLVNSRIFRGGDWAGSASPVISSAVPLMVTPPLFALKRGGENKLRIIRTEGDLPADRESLFTLSIAAIPSGKPEADSVQVAVRSRLKLFWRPEGLKGSPEDAYRQLRWQNTPSGLSITNPTPFYVTIFGLSTDGTPVDNAGMVAPYATRQTLWCQGRQTCALRWQSINDYGRIMPAVSLRVEGGAPVSAGGGSARQH